MLIERKDLDSIGPLVTIEPVRELKSHEQIVDLFQVIDGNKVHVGFVIEASESASTSNRIWVGSKLVENE